MLLFPLNYKQIQSTQTTQALNPIVQEIKGKYAENKDMQNKMVALLYQETKVCTVSYHIMQRTSIFLLT